MPLVKVGIGVIEILDAREPDSFSREYQVGFENLYGEFLIRVKGE